MTTTHWSKADDAELDVLVWALVDGVFTHRERCALCEGPLPCPYVSEAITQVADWTHARRLLTVAEEMRLARQVELARVEAT